MIDHKRELAEWCRQHQLQPPLYDREAVGPSTQVFPHHHHHHPHQHPVHHQLSQYLLYDREAVGPSTQVFPIIITIVAIIIAIAFIIMSINLTIYTSLTMVATRGRIPASCFAWPTG